MKRGVISLHSSSDRTMIQTHITHRSTTLSVPEFISVVAEKSLCLLILPGESAMLPMDGVLGMEDEGVTSPLLRPLPFPEDSLLSRKMALMNSPTSPPAAAPLLGVEGPPEAPPGVG